MTIALYTITEVLSLGFFGLGSFYKRKRFVRYLCLAISFIIPCCVIIFRDLTVGTDYVTYYNAILRISDNNPNPYDEDWLGLGFRLLIHFFSLWGIPSNIIPFVVIGFISIATLSIIFFVIWRYSSHATWGLYLFYCSCLYFQMMNQFRQMFAISLIFLAFTYGLNAYRKSIPLIILAALFHSSAWIMLPCIFIVRMQFTKRIIAIYCFATLMLALSYPFIEILLSDTVYGERYFGRDDLDVSLSMNSIFNLAFRVLLLLFCFKMRKKITSSIDFQSNSAFYNMLYHMTFLCLLTQVLTVFGSYLFGRVTTYFFIFYTLLLPPTFFARSDILPATNKLFFKYCAIIICLSYQFVYYLTNGEPSGYTAYQFV
ncbi:EpsG family protein [Bifidobacterium phasiani]|uniref:EpsG family protein n=1 Tax=Bifidobacterium phasiani TaxID=2834431 RepID=A0ABS6WA31_9BIFI|nr:EpsG family protein [Bifidobacterium phasiani]